MKTIFLVGYMASGKTTVGRQMAQELGLPFTDLDELIEKTSGQNIGQLFLREGEIHFRELERNVLSELIQSGTTGVIACGGGTPCFFDNMSAMNEHGLTIWLDVPVEVICDRLEADQQERPLIRGRSGSELRSFIRQHLEERKRCYSKARIHVREPFPGSWNEFFCQVLPPDTADSASDH